MKNVTLIFFLLLYYYGLSQNSIIKPPAILLNSLELKIEVRKGKNYYSRTDDDRKLYDRKYEIMIHIEAKNAITNYASVIHEEGKDYDLGLAFEGKYTEVIEQGFFKKGYKNGFWKTTYKNKLIKTKNYSNGLTIGKYRVYNTKGALLYKTTFGQKGNGKYKDFYYKTGILKEEGNYENGKKEGEWCTYNEKGNTKEIIFYEKGNPIKK